VLDVRELTDGTRQIQLASDGLDIGMKLAVERGLKQRLAEAPEARAHGEVAIYFKRRQAAGGAVAKGPAPLKEKTSPFGLKIDKKAIPGVAEVIVVASGKGGVGKSTVSVNLAVALAAQGKRTGLLDADVYGPSAPMMLGAGGQLGVTEGNRLVPAEAYGVKTVSFGFLTDAQQPVIWRGPLVGKALKQFCYDVAWGELDYLVVDLPPGTGDVQLALIESIPIHGALIVTTPQDVALLDAHKALTMFEKLDVPVLGMVENMAHYACPKCGHEEPIFGEGGAERMAEERKLTILSRIPLAAGVRRAGDEGRPVALDPESPWGRPFRELAEKVARPTQLV
jgi:ATP-binding protein involved in chromosome partitioning